MNKTLVLTLGGTTIAISLAVLAGNCDFTISDDSPDAGIVDAGYDITPSEPVSDAGLPPHVMPEPEPSPPNLDFHMVQPVGPRTERAVSVYTKEELMAQAKSGTRLLVRANIDCDPCFFDNITDFGITSYNPPPGMDGTVYPKERYNIGRVLLGANVKRVHLEGGTYSNIGLLHPPTEAEAVTDVTIHDVEIDGQASRNCLELRGQRIRISNSVCRNTEKYCAWVDSAFVGKTTDVVFSDVDFETAGIESCIRLTDVDRILIRNAKLKSSLKHVWRVHGKSTNIHIENVTGQQRGFMAGTMLGDELDHVTHLDSIYYMKELGVAGDDSCFDFNVHRVSNLNVKNVHCHTNRFCAIPLQMQSGREDWSIEDSSCQPAL